MRKAFTPEDLEHIRATYQSYLANLRWMTRHIISAGVFALGMRSFAGYVFPHLLAWLGMPTEVGVVEPNIALAVGLIYGATLPSLDFKGPRLSFGAFLVAPVAVAREFGNRVADMAGRRRALKERFADYY